MKIKEIENTELRELAIKRMKQDFSKVELAEARRRHGDIREVPLSGAFFWMNTSEGQTFWENVNAGKITEIEG